MVTIPRIALSSGMFVDHKGTSLELSLTEVQGLLGRYQVLAICLELFHITPARVLLVLACIQLKEKSGGLQF